jgi:SAM-dependent methyltransferase
MDSVIDLPVQAARRVRASFLARQNHGRAPKSGMPLPPLRYRMGGAHFRTDEAFVAGGMRDVSRLMELAALDERSRLLDFGSGAGRLAIGLGETLGRVAEYVGVDAQAELVRWCATNLGPFPGYRFELLDAPNGRYNPSGRAEHRFNAPAGRFDVAYAYSVFSHMQGDDARRYLGEFARVLAPSGRAFITCFVEDDVEEETVNPDDYADMAWRGPLHCVRFNRSWFEEQLRSFNFGIEHFARGTETDGQSLYVVGRARSTQAR